MSKVWLVPLASPLHDPQISQTVLERVQSELEPLTSQLEFYPIVTRCDQAPPPQSLVILFTLTGGTEFLGVEIKAEEYLILVHPRSNSLPSALELRTYYIAEGKIATIVDLAGLKRVLNLKMRAWQVAQAFRQSRLALIGQPSSWLVASMISPELVRQRWGIQIDQFGIEEMVRRFEGQESTSLGDWLNVPGKNIRSEDRISALRFFQAILGFFKENPYDGFSLACFDFLMQTGTAGCLSLASLNDLGITAACEGDLPSLLTMRLLSLVADSPTFMANPAWIEAQRVLLAHCTVAPSLVERFTLRTHFESGKSVALAGNFASGTYTLAKIAPSLEGIFFAPCQVQPWEKKEDLCRTQVLLHLEEAYLLKELPLANHLVLVPGDWTEQLQEIASILKLSILGHPAGGY